MSELLYQAQTAYDAANRALAVGDFETHFLWGRAFHQLANRIRDEYGVEIRL